MAKTKQEVRDWLNARVGTTVADKSNAALNGQCVALVKGLMEFLGVANPYAARGNARDAGDNYIAQGIGTGGKGWLTICVNRSMGGGYGHIWADLKDEANFEQNGAVALKVTKNTRPISQAQQFINFDKWIGGETMIIGNDDNWFERCNKTHLEIRGRTLDKNVFKSYVGKDFYYFVVDCSDDPEADAVQNLQSVGQKAISDNWEKQIADLKAENKKLKDTPTDSGDYEVATVYVKKKK